jgi:phosphopantothenoylcysteine decarboxylase / phosphopantothenate---cysteine ligase
MSRILVGITGGIAAYKSCELVRRLARDGHEVRCVATQNALRFVSPLTLATLSGHPVRSELFDLGEESEISHIALADWPEAVVVAPASAQSLARFAHGLADDLLSTVLLATRAPVVLAPAMNVNMYRHPATQANLDLLAKRGARIVGPDRGELACGWEGEGRLVDLDEITGALRRVLAAPTLAGEVVLITAGPTAEPIDPVRVLTNRSSGKMGFALAQEAVERGAEVVLVAGPVSLPTPHGAQRIDVQTALEMHDAVLEALPRATIVIAAAAVADYRAARAEPSKIKRRDRAELELALVRNPDVSLAVAERKGGRTLVGFAAETEALLENAREKLARKGYDLIVANDVSRSEIGFDADSNEVLIVGPGPDDLARVPFAPKREVAGRILDRIARLRRPA